MFRPPKTTAPLLVADHPALEFLNSTFSPDGNVHELIRDGQAFLVWLVEAQLLDERTAIRWKQRFGAQALDKVAHEARSLRTWAGEWIQRWRKRPGEPYEAEARKLNGLL